ncbi:MAG: DNA repair protein RadC [Treponema sp.]|nr:DNA repair protein RadC [Treponema sp.]
MNYCSIVRSGKPDIREQTLKHGISFPSDEELVMLILGSGTRGHSVRSVARAVVQTLYTVNGEEIIERLRSLTGMGMGKSLAIAAALELGRRRNGHLHAVIHSPEDVIPFIRGYAMQPKEHFLCITLNGGHEIIQIRVISIGTINQTIVHPREIFSEALMQNAAAIIVCHNHPSGNCEPSAEDIETTQTLLSAAKIIGIALLDHIIIDRDSYFSFLEHNLLF